MLLGAAWSAFHLGDNRRAAPLAADGITCARHAGEPQLEAWGRNLLAGLAWHAGDADRIVAEIEASRALSGQADPALAARAQSLLATAAFLSGDLAEQARHGLLAVELARTAAGQEGLVLALTTWAMSAIAGAGIQPATMTALDEAANLIAAHPDRFAETIMRQCRARLFATLGQLDAAETEVGLCWAAGRSGAVRLVESTGPPAEARLAAARGDTATAVGALRRAADGGRRVGIVMFVPADLAGLACMAAIAGDESTAAAAVGRGARRARRAPPGDHRCRARATPRASWPGTGASSPTPSTWSARPPCSGTAAATGWTPATASSYSACSPRPASASPTPHACSPPPTRPGGRCGTWHPDSPPTAAPPHAPPARPGTSSATTASPRHGNEGQGLTLDDAVAYAARKGGGRKRPATGWASLTPAEREVVRLVGEGLRNDAIARRLFIAPGTVKVHLTHIFAKLGITTRTELAAQAATQDLTAR